MPISSVEWNFNCIECRKIINNLTRESGFWKYFYTNWNKIRFIRSKNLFGKIAIFLVEFAYKFIYNKNVKEPLVQWVWASILLFYIGRPTINSISIIYDVKSKEQAGFL